MKDISILTMHMVDNFGSVLQAYGLKKTIEKLGGSVCFLDIKNNMKENQVIQNSGLCYNFENEVGGKGLSRDKIDKYFLRRVARKITGFGEKQNLLFHEFRRKELEIAKVKTKYDLCVIGADEVFSCQPGTPWGFTTQLFGNVDNATKVVTYAASCGPTKFSDLPKEVTGLIREAMNNISSISVRDKNTLDFVLNITGCTDNSINENIDPALLYDFSEEVNNALIPELPSNYCVIYAYKNRFVKKEEIEGILSFCKRNKLTPITIGGPQVWCKKHIICTPFECLKIFKESAFVITDTFHGAIFSIQFAKRFAIFVRDSNRNKLEDLIDRVGIESHLLSDFGELRAPGKFVKDCNKIDKLLMKERVKSCNYLKECLK